MRYKFPTPLSNISYFVLVTYRRRSSCTKRQKDIEFLGYTFKNFDAVNHKSNSSETNKPRRPSLAELQESMRTVAGQQ